MFRLHGKERLNLLQTNHLNQAIYCQALPALDDRISNDAPPQLYYLNRLVMQDMAGCLPLHDKKGRALARPEVTPTGFKPVTF